MRGLLFLNDPGTALQLRRGALCVRHDDGTEDHFPPRLHGLRTIILAGHGASITSEAIRWAAREGVAIFVMERAGECHAILSGSHLIDGRRKALSIRQKQFAAVIDERKRLVIARKIVAAKLATLHLHPVDRRAFGAELAQARRLDDILTCEARAGAAFFMRFRGETLNFCRLRPKGSE